MGCEDTSGSTIREPYALKHIVSYTKSCYIFVSFTTGTIPGCPYTIMRYGECYVALRSQRTNHVLHYEYTSTGENLPFLEEEYEIATENGVFQMNGRWSDNPIVL